MTVDLFMRTTEDTRDLLNVTLTEMQNGYGWRRTFPVNVADSYMIVPSYSEIAAYIITGTEDTTSIRTRNNGYGHYPEANHPIIKDWENNFPQCGDSHQYERSDRTVHRVENSDPIRYPRMRLSAAEIIDMKIWEIGFFKNTQHYGLEDQHGIVHPTELASIGLLLPVLPVDHQYTPLQATHFLMEANQAIFIACYYGEVTYAELLAVLSNWDGLRTYITEYYASNEEKLAAATKLSLYFKALRNTVATEHLIEWSTIGYRLNATIEDIMMLFNRITPAQGWDFINQGINDIHLIKKLIDHDIDFTMATQLGIG